MWTQEGRALRTEGLACAKVNGIQTSEEKGIVGGDEVRRGQTKVTVIRSQWKAKNSAMMWHLL